MEAVTRYARWIVGWAQYTRLVLQVIIDLSTVPGMVTQCHYVCAMIQKLIGEVRRNPHASCGIFTVNNDEIDVLGNPERLQNVYQ
jgi:hypothetical protein